MTPAIFRRCTWVALLLAASAALAQPAAFAERCSPVPTSADGIGKRYMGREISAVMGWQGAAWLEREERDREERTDLLLAALALQPGMVVADIGAGKRMTSWVEDSKGLMVRAGGAVRHTASASCDRSSRGSVARIRSQATTPICVATLTSYGRTR